MFILMYFRDLPNNIVVLRDKVEANVILLATVDRKSGHHHPAVSLFPKKQENNLVMRYSFFVATYYLYWFSFSMNNLHKMLRTLKFTVT